MRVSELYSQVAKLGFEDTLEDGQAFYYALNRATVQVNAIRPKIGVIEIFNKPLDNRISDYSFTAREVFPNVEYSAVGAKAYYFEVIGEGNYKITYTKDDAEHTAVGNKFNTNTFTPIRGLVTTEEGNWIEDEVKLTISGDFVIYVRSAALYDKLYSSNPDDVPAFRKWVPYDISVLASDFLALEERPLTSETGITINDGYEIEDGKVLLLPYDTPGCYKIRYKKQMPKIEYTNAPLSDDTEIELDDELCTLLPLLMASYLWLDDEPTKAQYYLTLYTARANEIEYKTKQLKPLNYNTNGW